MGDPGGERYPGDTPSGTDATADASLLDSVGYLMFPKPRNCQKDPKLVDVPTTSALYEKALSSPPWLQSIWCCCKDKTKRNGLSRRWCLHCEIGDILVVLGVWVTLLQPWTFFKIAISKTNSNIVCTIDGSIFNQATKQRWYKIQSLSSHMMCWWLMRLFCDGLILDPLTPESIVNGWTLNFNALSLIKSLG